MNDYFEDYESNKTEVKALIEELNNATISLENHKRYLDRISNNDKMVKLQLDNLSYDYSMLSKQFTEREKEKEFSERKNREIVALKDYERVTRMMNLLSNAYSWKSLISNLYKIMFKKIASLLDEVNALSIKKDALNEMREMEAERQKMYLDSFKSLLSYHKTTFDAKMQSYDDKYFNIIVALDEEHKREQKQMMNVFTTVFERLEVFLGKNIDNKLLDSESSFKKTVEEKNIKSKRQTDDKKNTVSEDSEDEVLETNFIDKDKESSVKKSDSNKKSVKSSEKKKSSSDDGLDDIDADFDKSFDDFD